MLNDTETLDDIIAAVEALPIEAFAAQGQALELRELVSRRSDEYFSSQEYKRQLRIAAKKNAERKTREEAQAKLNEKWAKKHVHAGDFIRVKGARDGHGVREVISVESDRLVCRAYARHHIWRGDTSSVPADAVTLGTKAFTPRVQMTDHMYNKVTHIYVNGGWQKLGV